MPRNVECHSLMAIDGPAVGRKAVVIAGATRFAFLTSGQEQARYMASNPGRMLPLGYQYKVVKSWLEYEKAVG